MNWRTNLLALAVYSLLGVIAAVVVYTTMRQWSYDVRQADSSLLDTTSPSADAGSSQAAHLDRSVTVPMPDRDDPGASSDLALLRTLLDERTEQLNAIRRRLEAAEKRRDELQKRYDRVLEMMDDWVAMVETMDDPGEEIPDSQTPKSHSSESPPQDQVPSETIERRVRDLQEELAALAIDLEQRDSQLAELSEQLIEEQAKWQYVAARLLRPLADRLVVPLQTMLADDRRDVRRWACELIIELGPAVRETEESLKELLESETDTSLRRMARDALEAIAD